MPPHASQMFDLSGRVAIVTGGNGGLGFAMALGLAEMGATIVIAARNPQKAERALDDLRSRGADCMCIEIDVASGISCRSAAETVADKFGRIDVLVNNAGINIRKLPQDYSEEDWHAVLDTNLTGPFHLCCAVQRHMKARQRGKIVNIGSIYSIFGAPKMAPYAASKGGLVQLTKVLASAWAADNIQVNVIVPGWFDTDLTKAARKQVEGLDDAVLARTPAQRWGAPNEVAGAAAFLSASASDFVTGAVIAVDGGYSSYG